MLIINQSARRLDISAPRETHLRDLEAYAANHTGTRWTAGPLTEDCQPDLARPGRLIWTLYPTQPTADRRYTITPEYCGHPERRRVLRFCGQFISSHQTADEARTAQYEHSARRNMQLQTDSTPP